MFAAEVRRGRGGSGPERSGRVKKNSVEKRTILQGRRYWEKYQLWVNQQEKPTKQWPLENLSQGHNELLIQRAGLGR
jgi:hypothetical protein